MKHIFISAIVLMFACGSGQDSQPTETASAQPDVHKVLVQEVIQTTNYTYLRVKEDENELWVAVPKMTASAGETYYYKEGMPMTNFTSKELNRTFNSILFLEQLSPTPEITKKEVPPPTPPNPNPQGENMTMPQSTAGAPEPEKQKVKTEPAKGGITIAELYKNKKSYAGKTVKIKGQVTKFNPLIMNTNWIHIQDGTDHAGKFDLTATTAEQVNVGETITLEGIITLDKDFGYGYSYEVLMEGAKVVK